MLIVLNRHWARSQYRESTLVILTNLWLCAEAHSGALLQDPEPKSRASCCAQTASGTFKIFVDFHHFYYYWIAGETLETAVDHAHSPFELQLL